ncbi:MAG: hypothetical protein A3J75_05025 [Acidobacteria bacterium RBG_16_68_9]|nr:MAG: hypothetical protein A3J75_05025 [Acidobacteria bacterium RBG_16_68_9]
MANVRRFDVYLPNGSAQFVVKEVATGRVCAKLRREPDADAMARMLDAIIGDTLDDLLKK